MKPSDFLDRLPSVSELLEHPQVRSAADRLSPSAVADQLRGYLDQLTAEARRRVAGAEAAAARRLPDSMQDLIDRVASYLQQSNSPPDGAAINATGRFRGGDWASPPLSAAAAEKLRLSAADFVVARSTGRSDSRLPDAASALRRAAGAADALVVGSHAAAVWLALTSISDGQDAGEVVVGRGDLVTLAPGCRVADLISRAGARAVEVGAADGATAGDYANAIGGGTSAVLQVSSDEMAPHATTDRVATAELAALTAPLEATLIVDAGAAPLLPVAGDSTAPFATAGDGLAAPTGAELIAAGADVVILRGDGLLGGPPCGVVLGSAEAIDRMRRHTLAATMAVEPHVDAAVAVTVEQIADAERFWFDVPVWSLLTTPLDNLRSRAERIAAQLAAGERIADAQPVEQSAAETAPAGLPIRLPTVAVAVTPALEDADSLLTRAKTASPPLWGRSDEGRVLLDLRTVFPRQDGQLVAAILGGDG